MKKSMFVLLILSLFSFADDGDLVRLKDFGDKPMIIGFILGNETKGYLIPNNTQAVVLEWYRDYTIKDIPSKHKDMISLYQNKVKILNGPLKDTILMVNHVYVFLE